MPHGTMCSRMYVMSVVTLRAKPCIVRPWARRTPIAAILRGFGAVDVDPHAGVLGEPADSREPELAQHIDQQLLDAAHVFGRAERVGDRQDRVPDELAGAVVCDVAAALDGDEVGADRGRVAAQVGLAGRPAAVREDVVVLEQQQVLLRAMLEQRGLDGQRLAVRHPAQPAHAEG